LPAPRLENTASRATDRIRAHFAKRDWNAMAQALADDFTAEDRRHVVNTGFRSGPDAQIANMRTIDELGCTRITATPIALRGDRVFLAHYSFIGDSAESVSINVIEVNADGKGLAAVTFDVDDMAAAFAELDARYLAGEAAAHSHTWSLVARTFGALNRR